MHLKCNESVFEGREYLIDFYSDTQCPITLQVCHESRTEALRQFTPTFATRNHTGLIYFDFSCDALWLDGLHGSDELINLWLDESLDFGPCFERIRHFVLVKNFEDWTCMGGPDIRADRRMLDNLLTSESLESIIILDSMSCEWSNSLIVEHLDEISCWRESSVLGGHDDGAYFGRPLPQFPSVQIVPWTSDESLDWISRLHRGEIIDNQETEVSRKIAEIRNRTDMEKAALAQRYI